MSEPVANSSRTILVVDDEASIVDALSKVLRKDGLSVLTAGNGREALDIVRRQPVDAMITDLRMPGMGGDDLLKAVKAITPEIEVIVMTAYGTVETAVEAMKRGAYDFISKPLKRASVLATVRKALDKAALLAENRQLRAQLEAAMACAALVDENIALDVRLACVIAWIACELWPKAPRSRGTRNLI